MYISFLRQWSSINNNVQSIESFSMKEIVPKLRTGLGETEMTLIFCQTQPSPFYSVYIIATYITLIRSQ